MSTVEFFRFCETGVSTTLIPRSEGVVILRLVVLKFNPLVLSDPTGSSVRGSVLSTSSSSVGGGVFLVFTGSSSGVYTFCSSGVYTFCSSGAYVFCSSGV